MRRLLPLVAACLIVAAAQAPAAPAAVPFTQCTGQGFQAFECGRLPQPLDHSGTLPGQVSLFVRRLRAPSNPTNTALVALAGGPGQAAAPLAPDFAIALAPALRERDLLVFDQRGTGQSDPLRCRALEDTRNDPAVVARRCANELGARRGLYRSIDSVEDLEALRREAGYDRLAIFGVSYGTKVALDYAARYPDRVERLALDSVVPPEGADPLQRTGFRAMRRVLRELCAERRCRGITPDPVSDLRNLVRRERDIRGTVVTASGRRSRVAFEPASSLYAIVRSGDLNPAWRALLPGAMRAAIRGDTAPLTRLAYATLGPTTSSFQVPEEDANMTLFLSTRCEEDPFPWPRDAKRNARISAVENALRREPSSTFSPFPPLIAVVTGTVTLCLEWPHATPAPAPAGPVPPVPTLMLAGRADTRTPVEDAAAVAGRVPGSTQVAVPHVGHSVLGADPSGCAAAAITGFFTGGAVGPCPRTGPLLPPLPQPPRSIRSLRPTGGVPGLAGRTLTAVLRTRDDVLMHALGERLEGRRTRFGGLRDGTVRVTSAGVTLTRVVVVPGVSVSGRFPEQGDARITVSGSRAARGRLTFLRSGRVTGRLGGRRISLRPRTTAYAAAAARLRGEIPHPRLVR